MVDDDDARPVIGIDLGTTYSAVAYCDGEQTVLIEVDGDVLLPSVVGLDPDGELVVGRAARNQRLLHPERTVRSIKRQMGDATEVRMGDESFTPVEISALILGRLKRAAETHLGEPVERAVITVPAYFTDAARTATREAGRVAGLQVERILNEPTAAALCYADADGDRWRTYMVYDLGGGTFDVSVVRTRGEVTEVLASHGDTSLGGDDMDELLSRELAREFEAQHGVDLVEPRSLARLERATEEAKIRLSVEAYVQVIEEHLARKGKKGLHLDVEVDRHTYEELIAELIDRTLDSVSTALSEAGLQMSDLDDVICVGGASRTPMVRDALHRVTGLLPRMDVNPDEAVALGAALAAARIAGRAPDRILVDVTPYSYGIAYVQEVSGRLVDDCYRPLIKRNSTIPTRYSETFYTLIDGQEAVEVDVFQGEAPYAPDNILVGRFRLEGLDEDAPRDNPVVIDLDLDINGVLRVSATEKRTGQVADIVIEDAFEVLGDEERVAAGARVAGLLGTDDSTIRREPTAIPEGVPSEHEELWTSANSLLERSTELEPELPDEDRDELTELAQTVRAHLDAGDWEAAQAAAAELDDALFYLE